MLLLLKKKKSNIAIPLLFLLSLPGCLTRFLYDQEISYHDIEEVTAASMDKNGALHLHARFDNNRIYHLYVSNLDSTSNRKYWDEISAVVRSDDPKTLPTSIRNIVLSPMTCDESKKVKYAGEDSFVIMSTWGWIQFYDPLLDNPDIFVQCINPPGVWSSSYSTTFVIFATPVTVAIDIVTLPIWGSLALYILATQGPG